MTQETIPDRLCEEIKQRRTMGLKKYGVLLADSQLTRKQCLQHAKEEALDLAEYLQFLIDLEDKPEFYPPKIWPTKEERIDAIGQNGNDGDHYRGDFTKDTE